MTKRVDQLLAGFADGDAISSEARLIRDLLRARGWISDIYVERRFTSPTMIAECRDLSEFRAGDAVIHHYSIGSPVLERFAGAACRKILMYHNITPPEYFRPYDAGVTRQLETARGFLAEIARKVDAVWAVSAFNASELRSLGIPRVEVFPLLFDPRACDRPDDPSVAGRFATPLTTFLTVSRIAPNKRIEHAIRAFDWYVKGINPFSRLIIVGSGRSCPRYFHALQMLVGDLDTPNICFEGFAAAEGLPTYYRNADVFLSTSEHEGFCLPVLEAMYHGVPVLARKVGGVPEAAGGAGILYDEAAPHELAVLMDSLAGNATLRSSIRTAQKRRMEALAGRRADEELQALLTPLVA